MSVDIRFRLARGQFLLDVDLSISRGGITAVFGPSGSGKTTLLRAIAGLDHAAAGYLRVGEVVWQDESSGIFVPTHKRSVGYVSQEADLFPHLSVRQNLEYGFKRAAKEMPWIGLTEAVELTGLGELLDRNPGRLSGGERQRTALARALLTSPRLLLMDEPLAGLDESARYEILPYLERLHDRMAVPLLYVSHAVDEVERLADRLVILEKGRVSAAGPVTEIASRLDLSLAHGREAAALVEAVVAEHDAEFALTYLDFSGGRISISRQDVAIGRRVRVRVLARDVSLTLDRPRQSSILNVLPAKILEISEDNPGQEVVRLDAGGCLLLSRITRKSSSQLGLKPGCELFAQVKSVALLS